jgi:hypothetical protein
MGGIDRQSRHRSEFEIHGCHMSSLAPLRGTNRLSTARGELLRSGENTIDSVGLIPTTKAYSYGDKLLILLALPTRFELVLQP